MSKALPSWCFPVAFPLLWAAILLAFVIGMKRERDAVAASHVVTMDTVTAAVPRETLVFSGQVIDQGSQSCTVRMIGETETLVSFHLTCTYRKVDPDE